MARRIRTWTDSWISSRYIRVGMRGTFSKVSSWLTDEGVLLTMREYIAAVGEKLTSHGLAKAVNEYLKEENIVGGAEDWERSLAISERTARIWLNKLGFQWKDIRKGVYVDGHERGDVVAYRQKLYAKPSHNMRAKYGGAEQKSFPLSYLGVAYAGLCMHEYLAYACAFMHIYRYGLSAMAFNQLNHIISCLTFALSNLSIY
ncbi:hypothetical protein L211DRAFT_679939 [Terfezia boudieri ATCC MYA-4762]|uniref:Uncharacterized protein n=1 Tax=Terfezia boudieri ATCC MYA-4762 TaxID=1051890 RepID=A0A3N4LZC4_9PEZI|nr:hypothetical protein L211DRAFT_679939 [Terfezia boudieri ATCC MYA-4762]